MKAHPTFEFHIADEIRKEYGIETALFSITGNVILADFKKARELAYKISGAPSASRKIKAGELVAMGLIDEILHYMVGLYRQQVCPPVFTEALGRFAASLGGTPTEALLTRFCTEFPPQAVYAGEADVAGYLAGSEAGYSHRPMTVEEMLLLALANLNPAFKPFLFFFDDGKLAKETVYPQAVEELKAHLAQLPVFGPDGQNLWDLLRAPALACPDSLAGQLRWIREKWGSLLGAFMARLLTALDVIAEEEKPDWHGAPGPTEVYDYGYIASEYERFSSDREWMPRCILMAKSTLVWLYQLSRKYGREIKTLDQIPDEEIDLLARRGFTGLWLIGLWERSNASRTIKQWKGNPEAAASAYSLYDYDIAWELGGWGALHNLRERCARRGVRLGSDMVPNHTGIDSRWIMEHPDRFLQLDYPPFPGYQYNSGDLSNNGDIVVQIEDKYYNNTDCAVVFHHYDKRSGRHRYIYHGNDGTSMPWNDTAQIDFLNTEAREAVINTIIGVCKQFPIVRFDAAMTLAKKHIQRLWYPEPGRGGDIASRAEHALSTEEFNKRIPNEFWREVVDRCASEAPDTLLLAEAFWMMEGYFVRTLGMHRVYNSAFMNMLKKEENQKYRDTIKNTLKFDSEVLKRFVNFMNNPDEETAVAQFGKGDKYFGICTLMVTMPGLPMFGHGQVEGFEEKYGMEYRRAYRDEEPDAGLVERHEREIFPLMKKRHIFSGASNFFLFDFWREGGGVNENVFAYTNSAQTENGNERALVFYNNSYESTAGWIQKSPIAIPQKGGGTRQDSLAEALSLRNDAPFFTLFHENRRNQWLIRSSKELHEKGIFAMLSGYEAQVFIDIYEVEDAAFNTWARLNAETNGAFFAGPPEEALQDLLFGPLYALFKEALAWGLGNGEQGLERGTGTGEQGIGSSGRNTNSNADSNARTDISDKNPSPQSLVPSPHPVPRFLEEVRRYASGEVAGVAGWGLGNGEQGTGSSGRDSNSNADSDVSADISATNPSPQSLVPSPHPVPSLQSPVPADFDYSLYTGKKAAGAKEAELYAAGFALLCAVESVAIRGSVASQGSGNSVRDVNSSVESNSGTDISAKTSTPDPRSPTLTEHLHLDRKLREYYEAAGISNAWRAVETMKAVLRRLGNNQGLGNGEQGTGISSRNTNSNADSNARTDIPAKSPVPNPQSPVPTYILQNHEAADFRAILGINVWEGTVYFNKECFEEAARLVPFLLSPFVDSAVLSQAQSALTQAAAQSEYKITKLLEALGDGTSTKSKTAGEKADAKPKTAGAPSKPKAPPPKTESKPKGGKKAK